MELLLQNTLRTSYLIRGFRNSTKVKVLVGFSSYTIGYISLTSIMITETSMKISTPEPFVHPPQISQVAVIAAGFAVTLLGSSWPIVVLVIAFLMSLFIPYCFRTTDHPEERRRLYQEYVQTPHPMIQKVLAVPEYVNLEERYWINSR